MSVQFILGRAGSGKTAHILGQLHQRLMDDPAGPPLVYLVPEQATFQAEYALATLPGLGGIVRAQVLSFGRMAYRILQETGGAARVAVDELGKQMALRMLLERQRDRLRLFGRSVERPGFVASLARLISECKRYGITADAFPDPDQFGGTLRDKLHDLALVMRAYDAYLEAGRCYDTDDMLTRVLQKIGSSAYIRNAEVWIDGFSGFTKQEYLVVRELIRHARQVTIALCLDPGEREYSPDELALFYPTLDTYHRLRKLAEEAGTEVLEPVLLREAKRFLRSPWLSHLERTYFRWGGQQPSPAPGRKDEVSLVTAASRRSEVEAAALRMLQLAREEGYRFRDMAVLLRETGDYADEIRNVFTAYRIPFFLDEKRSVMHHPLVELVRSALDVLSTHWSYEAVFRCLKTDLLIPRRDKSVREMREEVDRLENYVLAYGISGNQWKQEEAWTFHEADRQDVYRDIDAVRRRFAKPLVALEQAMKAAEKENVREMTTALYRFLADLGVPETLENWVRQAEQTGNLEEAREHGQVWNGLMNLFDQVVETLGEERVEIPAYARILQSGLESLRLGLVPPALDQVVIGTMERSRQPEVKAVFILGANDGVIPLRPSEDGILDESEREKLQAAGLELAPGATRRLLAEQYLLYQALTRPSERLWLSCALADEEGKALLPSSVFGRIKELLDGVTVSFFAGEPGGDAEADIRLLGRPGQAFGQLLAMLRQLKSGRPLPPLWREVYNWFAAGNFVSFRERWLLSGLDFRNQAKRLSPELSRKLFGRSLSMSVSRMERFQACPFSHFSAYGLRLVERPLYRLERVDVGELFHASLKLAVEHMKQRRIDWRDVTEESGMKLAGEIVDELIPQTRSSILVRTARYRYLAGKLKRSVGRAIVVLGEHARRSRFAPVGLEVEFGPNGELPGLTLVVDEAEGVTITLNGRIDRVDQSIEPGRKFLRVIDYKSGSKKLSLSDVWHGLNLQLLVYLDVVVTNAEKWLGEKADAAGVFYYQVADPFVTAKRSLSREEVEKERSRKLKMKGLMLADTELARLMDEWVSMGPSEILPFGLKKDGTFSAYSSVATAEQFQSLTQYVRSLVKQIGKRLTSGETAIAPFSQGAVLACDVCAYKPVCQYDQLFEGNQSRPVAKWKDAEVWQMIEQRQRDGWKGEEA